MLDCMALRGFERKSCSGAERRRHGSLEVWIPAVPWPACAPSCSRLARMMLLDVTVTRTREEILAAIDAHAPELRRLGAKSLALFGSIARGEGSSASDVDLLVELAPKTFDTYMDVKLFLEQLLGRRVDLVLADAVKARLRPTILAEAVHASRL